MAYDLSSHEMRNADQADPREWRLSYMRMRDSTQADYEHRIRAVLSLLMDAVYDGADGPPLAESACFSRYHFQRVFKRVLAETPGALRKRLPLERAAFRLMDTRASVTEIGIDAGYDSLEAFTRAFRRGFGVAPSAFRLMERTRFHLQTPNGIHFRPSGWALPAASLMQRGDDMDLLDRLLDHDAIALRQLITAASNLSDTQLDTKIAPYNDSLRKMLERAVWQKEMWVAAVQGRKLLEEAENCPAALLKRMNIAYPAFADIARGVRDRGEWDRHFVDAICEPAETFTFGGMLAHVITHSAHRRAMMVDAFQKLGVEPEGQFDPLGWEKHMEAASA